MTAVQALIACVPRAAPHVDLTCYFEPLGITAVRRERAIGWSALLEETADGFLVRVNMAEPFVRRRFSVAHELGHALLSRTEGAPTEPAHVERLCDQIASVLLIPPQCITDHALIQVEQMHLRGLSSLARSYRVSVGVAALRLFPRLTSAMAFVCWRYGVRNGSSSRTWRVDWSTASPSFGEFIPRDISASEQLTRMLESRYAGGFQGTMLNRSQTNLDLTFARARLTRESAHVVAALPK